MTGNAEPTEGLEQAVASVGARPLVLVDIENLVRGWQHRSAIELRISELDAALPTDSMVRVAAHPVVARAVWFAPGAKPWRKLAPRRGSNASDLALLDTLDEPIPAGCDSLVIASGDHIFARAIRKVGLPTLVISLPECLSTKLEAAADVVAHPAPVESLPHRRLRIRRCTVAQGPVRPTSMPSDLLDLRSHEASYGRTEQPVSVTA